MQMTREKATTFMRWVIVLTLFGMVIWQSNRIDELKQQLNYKTVLYNGLSVNWGELNQQYTALAKACLK